MPNENKHPQKHRSKAIISSDVRDYGNDPYFIKKADDSQRFLEKHGLPEAYLKRSGRA